MGAAGYRESELSKLREKRWLHKQQQPQLPRPYRLPLTISHAPRPTCTLACSPNEGRFGKFYHLRELPLEGTGVRPNCDTLYSQAVFDLDARPVTITLPDAGKRFMSMMVIDEDHYVTEVATAREITAIPRRKSAPAMALRQSALWSIRQTRKTSSRFTPWRIRSRWSSPVGPAS